MASKMPQDGPKIVPTAPLATLGRSWTALGPSSGDLGASGSDLGSLLGDLEAILESLGANFDRLRAILGRPWGSWGDLGAPRMEK